MYKNTFQDVLEAEKGAKQKWVLFFETPCSPRDMYGTIHRSAFNIIMSDYRFRGNKYCKYFIRLIEISEKGCKKFIRLSESMEEGM